MGIYFQTLNFKWSDKHAVNLLGVGSCRLVTTHELVQAQATSLSGQAADGHEYSGYSGCRNVGMRYPTYSLKGHIQGP